MPRSDVIKNIEMFFSSKDQLDYKKISDVRYIKHVLDTLCKNYGIKYCEKLFETFEATLIPLLTLEVQRAHFNAFTLTAVFGSYELVAAYVKKVAANINFVVTDKPELVTNKAFHEALRSIILPQSIDWTVNLWQGLAMRQLPSRNFAHVFRYAAEIEKYVKENEEPLKAAMNEKIKAQFAAKGAYEEHVYQNACRNAHQHILSVHTDLKTLQDYAAMVAYKNADKNPAAAKLFFKFNLREEQFNAYLQFKPKDDDQLIPAVTIDGESVGHVQYRLEKLSSFLPEAAVLGRYTGCCQTLDDYGAALVKFAIEHANCGFYVMRRCKDNLIVAQALAWRNTKTNIIVFDSVESYEPYRKDEKREMVCHFFSQLAKVLVQNHGIPKVLVGKGGNTPKEFGSLTRSPDKFFKDLPYSDAREQGLLASSKRLLMPEL